MNDSWKIFNLTYIDQNNILIDGVKYTKKQYICNQNLINKPL